MFLSQGFEACFCRRVLFKVTLHPSFSSTHSLVIYQGGGCIGERVVLVNVYRFFCPVTCPDPFSMRLVLSAHPPGLPQSPPSHEKTSPVLQLHWRCRYFETVVGPTQHKWDLTGSGWFPPFQIKVLWCICPRPVMTRLRESFRTGGTKLSSRCARTAKSFYQPSTWPLSSVWTTGNGSMTPSSARSLT